MSLEDLEKELYFKKNFAKKSKNEEVDKNNNGDSKKNVKSAGTGNDSVISKYGSKVVNLYKKTKESPWGQEIGAGGSKSNFDTEKAIGFFQKYGKILLLSLVLLVVIMLGVSGYYLYQFFSTKGISISTSAPDRVFVGEEFNAEIVLGNNTKKVLGGSVISLVLPDGVISSEYPQKRIIEKSLDRGISPGEVIKEKFPVVITGDPNRTYELGFVFSYQYGESSLSNKFQKKTSLNILASDPIVKANLSAPEKVLNGEDFEISFTYKNLSNKKLDDVKISFDFPENLRINGSDPKLDNMRIVRSIAGNEDGVVVISASMIGKEYSFFTLSADVSMKIGGDYHSINKVSNQISISPSPLSIRIEPNKGDGFVYPGDTITYNVIYRNNSDIALRDVVAKIFINGSMVDYSSIDSDGYFDAANKIITWTASEIPEFKSLAPRQVGSFKFSLKLLNDYPIQSLSDKNFKIDIRGEISSPTTPENVIASETIGVASVQNKVGGTITLDKKLYYRDPSGQIVNSGPIPPRVGASTEYTIYLNFIVKGADFENVKLSAFLGNGVEWTGKVITNIKETPSYNSRTKEITWEISKIISGSGVVTTAPTSVIQLRFTPSMVQLGDRSLLIIRGTLSAHDTFTGKDVSYSIGQVKIDDLLDGDAPSNYYKVVK